MNETLKQLAAEHGFAAILRELSECIAEEAESLSQCETDADEAECLDAIAGDLVSAAQRIEEVSDGA